MLEQYRKRGKAEGLEQGTQIVYWGILSNSPSFTVLRKVLRDLLVFILDSYRFCESYRIALTYEKSHQVRSLHCAVFIASSLLFFNTVERSGVTGGAGYEAKG